MDLFKTIKDVYTKNKTNINDIDNWSNILLSRWFSYDRDNLIFLKNISKYLCVIKAEYYYYLLYFNITKKDKVPFLSQVKQEKKKESKLVDYIKEYFNWSERELKFNSNIINNMLLKEKYWLEELGIN